MTPGPDYYRLADGRQFYEYSRDELVPYCLGRGYSHWKVHCIISAMEHWFRQDAKPGESQTDDEACLFWLELASQEGGPDIVGMCELSDMIVAEREKVGR